MATAKKADAPEVEVDLTDTSAYVGVDPMYQNAADVANHALAGDDEAPSQANDFAVVTETVNPDGDVAGPSSVTAVKATDGDDA